jgi:hypothetical protein
VEIRIADKSDGNAGEDADYSEEEKTVSRSNEGSSLDGRGFSFGCPREGIRYLLAQARARRSALLSIERSG